MNVIVAAILMYVTIQQFSSLDGTLSETILVGSNVLCAICLFVFSLSKYSTERALLKPIASEQEDVVLNRLERRIYNASFLLLIAFVVSLVTMVIGFIVTRHAHPEIVGVSFIVMTVSIFSVITGSKTSALIYPQDYFKKPIQTVDEALDVFDDGQKYIFLKTLYRLYFTVIFSLIFLMFVLMYYSIISGVSQVLGIVGIGIILFFMLAVFGLCLKPSKLLS